MSEAPETIWATAYYNQNRSEHVQLWSTTGFDGRQQAEYRRADLPPTLSAAMELPEVVALVAALEHIASGASDNSEKIALAALAAIKEPKT